MPEAKKKWPAVLILFAWLLAGVPMGWGVHKTRQYPMTHFQSGPATVAPPTK
jgi:hypothetical protein